MDGPVLQYVETADGVRIAYYSMGEGPALVLMPALPFRHILKQWELEPSPDRQIARVLLDGGRRLVQFDPRGNGSSSPVESLSIEGYVRDLEAVADHLDLEHFDIAALTHSCSVAIAYAAQHPDRVERLALFWPFAHGATALNTTTGRAVRAIRELDWETYTDTINHIMQRGNREEAERSTALMRAVGPEAVSRIIPFLETTDIGHLLSSVRAPTLVYTQPVENLVSKDQAREVAAGIPNAKLVETDEPFMFVAGRFLGLLDAAAGSADPRATSSTAVILFADIADSTAMTERLGDAAFRDKARELDSALRRSIEASSGQPIDGRLLGDGVLATFAAAAQAIDAALQCGQQGDRAGLPLHLGLHAGDVIREDNNVYGGAVNIASRISELSAPGEVLVSDIVRGLARTSTGVAFADRGEQRLKGISETVRVYSVTAQDSA
jgi:class 3 adenylate cyclase